MTDRISSELNMISEAVEFSRSDSQSNNAAVSELERQLNDQTLESDSSAENAFREQVFHPDLNIENGIGQVQNNLNNDQQPFSNHLHNFELYQNRFSEISQGKMSIDSYGQRQGMVNSISNINGQLQIETPDKQTARQNQGSANDQFNRISQEFFFGDQNSEGGSRRDQFNSLLDDQLQFVRNNSFNHDAAAFNISQKDLNRNSSGFYSNGGVFGGQFRSQYGQSIGPNRFSSNYGGLFNPDENLKLQTGGSSLFGFNRSSNGFLEIGLPDKLNSNQNVSEFEKNIAGEQNSMNHAEEDLQQMLSQQLRGTSAADNSGIKIEAREVGDTSAVVDVGMKAEDANDSLGFGGIQFGTNQFLEHDRLSGMNSLTRRDHLPRESFGFGLGLGELVIMKQESTESGFGGMSLNGDLIVRNSLPPRISARSLGGRNSDLLVGQQNIIRGGSLSRACLVQRVSNATRLSDSACSRFSFPTFDYEAQKQLAQQLSANPQARQLHLAAYSNRSSKLSNDTEDSYDQKEKKRKIKQEEIILTCNCGKTRCLKLYCVCFQVGSMCTDNCHCTDCQNTEEHTEEREKAIAAILAKNPQAFQTKIEVVDEFQKIEDIDGLEEYMRNLEQQQLINSGVNAMNALNSALAHKKGCNCKKTMCKKKYCECYGAGVKCSNLCKCEGCMNGKSDGSDVHGQHINIEGSNIVDLENYSKGNVVSIKTENNFFGNIKLQVFNGGGFGLRGNLKIEQVDDEREEQQQQHNNVQTLLLGTADNNKIRENSIITNEDNEKQINMQTDKFELNHSRFTISEIEKEYTQRKKKKNVKTESEVDGAEGEYGGQGIVVQYNEEILAAAAAAAELDDHRFLNFTGKMSIESKQSDRLSTDLAHRFNFEDTIPQQDEQRDSDFMNRPSQNARFINMNRGTSQFHSNNNGLNFE